MADTVEWGPGVSGLGPEWDAVLARGPGIQSGRAWFSATEAAARPAGARAATLALRGPGGAPLGLLPLWRNGVAGSLTSPYSVLFQPLVDPAEARALGRGAGRRLRAWPVTTLDALDPDWPGLVPLLAGFRRAGLVPLVFEQFGNWHQPVSGWDAYLAARPGALRETVRRKGRLAERDGVRFQVVRDPADIPAGLAAYEDVYARSWKVPEPFPGFGAALLSRLAPRGEVRLGVLWRGNEAVAAQYWTVADGVATVLKLAHDERHKALSPGTLLTAHLIRGLIGEGVRVLDFGRGDDPYKRQWAGLRRRRVGVLLANPLFPRGLAAIARHAAGALVRGLKNRARPPISAPNETETSPR